MGMTIADKEQLLQRAAVVRDETMEKANTALRVGSLLYDIIRFIGSMDIDELSEFFLRKDRDDTARGKITLERGAEFGKNKDAFIDGNGKAELLSLLVRTDRKSVV